MISNPLLFFFLHNIGLTNKIYDINSSLISIHIIQNIFSWKCLHMFHGVTNIWSTIGFIFLHTWINMIILSILHELEMFLKIVLEK